ncbi:hypothetical protein ACHQM5_030576 [Ranunculus cassubicifolius]
MEVYHKCSISTPFQPHYYHRIKTIHRRDFPINTRTRAQVNKVAKLFAGRRERVEFPNYDDQSHRFSEFLSQPAGFKSILNTKAVDDFQCLDSNTYRCVLPKIKLLKFEVSPVLDLRVTPTSGDCTVEMLSCKFEGSEAVERQNDRFSASMKNHITWSTEGDRYLEADMKLNVSLEVYTRPFTILPVSAIEKPGNLVMQSLVDRLVPLLLKNLVQDYENWVQEQCGVVLSQ